MENYKDYTKRQFMIFNVAELNKINFEEVCETSEKTIRKSINGTKTFIKWETEEMPSCLSELIYKEGPYTYNEILNILSTEEWINNI